jgi:hypothetical protein
MGGLGGRGAGMGYREIGMECLDGSIVTFTSYAPDGYRLRIRTEQSDLTLWAILTESEVERLIARMQEVLADSD